MSDVPPTRGTTTRPAVLILTILSDSSRPLLRNVRFRLAGRGAGRHARAVSEGEPSAGRTPSRPLERDAATDLRTTRLLVDEYEGVAAVSCSPQLGSVRPGARRTPRWPPPLDVFKIRLNVNPQTLSAGRVDPTFNTTAALDDDSIQFLKGQQALYLDPHELVGERELGAIGREQPRPVLFHPLPAWTLAGLARLCHLAIFNQRPQSPPPGFDPWRWTPRKRGCSSWEVNVGSSLLSTRTRP